MRFLSIFSIIVMFTGCTSFQPLPISEPPAFKSPNVKTSPDFGKGGLLPATSLQEVKDNIKIYADWYLDRALKLRGYEYNASETGFIGGAIGVLGGIAKSSEAAIAGGLFASGASMTSERYQFLVQAQNYERVSDVLYCMYRNVYPEPNDLPITASGITEINQIIDELRIKLRKNQANITLANPDLNVLEASIKQQIGSEANLVQVKLSAPLIKAAVDLATQQVLIDKLRKCAASY